MKHIFIIISLCITQLSYSNTFTLKDMKDCSQNFIEDSNKLETIKNLIQKDKEKIITINLDCFNFNSKRRTPIIGLTMKQRMAIKYDNIEKLIIKGEKYKNLVFLGYFLNYEFIIKETVLPYELNQKINLEHYNTISRIFNSIPNHYFSFDTDTFNNLTFNKKLEVLEDFNLEDTVYTSPILITKEDINDIINNDNYLIKVNKSPFNIVRDIQNTEKEFQEIKENIIKYRQTARYLNSPRVITKRNKIYVIDKDSKITNKLKNIYKENNINSLEKLESIASSTRSNEVKLKVQNFKGELFKIFFSSLNKRTIDMNKIKNSNISNDYLYVLLLDHCAEFDCNFESIKNIYKNIKNTNHYKDRIVRIYEKFIKSLNFDSLIYIAKELNYKKPKISFVFIDAIKYLEDNERAAKFKTKFFQLLDYKFPERGKILTDINEITEKIFSSNSYYKTEFYMNRIKTKHFRGVIVEKNLLIDKKYVRYLPIYLEPNLESKPFEILINSEYLNYKTLSGTYDGDIPNRLKFYGKENNFYIIKTLKNEKRYVHQAFILYRYMIEQQFRNLISFKDQCDTYIKKEELRINKDNIIEVKGKIQKAKIYYSEYYDDIEYRDIPDSRNNKYIPVLDENGKLNFYFGMYRNCELDKVKVE